MRNLGQRPQAALIDGAAEAVGTEFSVSKALLFRRDGCRRTKANIGLARQVAQYLVSVSLGFGQTAAAEAFGFDRTNVAYAVKRVEDLRDDSGFDARLSRLELRFEAQRCAA